MNNDWKTFIEDNGAVINDGIVQHFGNPEREQQASVSGTVMTDLSHLGIIRARGNDATTFLQGQLSNDITQVDEQHCQISGYCNPQGRLLAIFQIFRYQDDYYLLLPSSLIQQTLERLKKYMLMSKLTLDDVSDDWVRIGVYGKKAEGLLQPLLGTLPEPEHSARINGEICTLSIAAGPVPRYLVFGPVTAMQTLWDKLNTHVAPVGAKNWGWHDIQAGLPVVYPETIGSFIPQMVNLDIFNGINFKKGCYTGQEIIARLHYRGTVKRRMFLAHIARDGLDTPPLPGDILYHDQGEQEGKAIGHIVRCQPSPDGGFSLLAVIVIELARNGLPQGEIHWQSVTGPVLEPRPLPYTINFDTAAT